MEPQEKCGGIHVEQTTLYHFCVRSPEERASDRIQDV